MALMTRIVISPLRALFQPFVSCLVYPIEKISNPTIKGKSDIRVARGSICTILMRSNCKRG